MAEQDATSGPIIIWSDYGCEGWKPRSFENVKEALEATRYGEPFIITRVVQYDVQESTDA